MLPTPSGETPVFGRLLFHGRRDGAANVVARLPDAGIEAAPYPRGPLVLEENDVAVVLLERPLHDLVAGPAPEGLGEGADRFGVLLVGDHPGPTDPFWAARILFSLPEGAADHHLARGIRSIFKTLEERALAARARRSLVQRTEDIKALNEIGIALAAETDPQRLMEMILLRARGITQADGGSLYLIEEGNGKPVLRFKVAQNDSIRLDFRESTLPLDGTSIAGHVATAGKTLRLDDVYAAPSDLPTQGFRQFDAQHGYRTLSMLAVPMKLPSGRTIGVLQLMNRKRRVTPNVGVTAVIRTEIVPFDENNQETARSLAGQAAVAIENVRLTEHLKRLFEGFVAASVTAIEQRDPTTSGHSQRVATLSCGLAEAAERISTGPYARWTITRQEMTELRYAAVLHDFGKVGVREWVLVKAKKLPPGRHAVVEERFETARLAVAAELWEKAFREKWPIEKLEQELASRVSELGAAWEVVQKANEPTVLPRETDVLLARAARIAYRDSGGRPHALLEGDELSYLSIPQGSLSPDERREIQSHVSQTYRFLSHIPWTHDLARVPDLAYSHHEKLDGSGYPRKLTGAQIPIPVRMMTISDIYDALSASDRPYKPAVPCERALEILHEEARMSRVDPELLRLFIDARVFELTAK